MLYALGIDPSSVDGYVSMVVGRRRWEACACIYFSGFGRFLVPKNCRGGVILCLLSSHVGCLESVHSLVILMNKLCFNLCIIMSKALFQSSFCYRW